MKSNLTLLLVCSTLFSFAQTIDESVYEDVPSKHAHGYLVEGTESDPSVFKMINLKSDTDHREWTSVDHRMVTSADYSVIHVTLDNIIRLDLKATHLGGSEHNSIEVEVFRDGVLKKKVEFKGVFRPHEYEDILPARFDWAGVDSLTIEFNTRGGKFVIGKLEVIPLNAKGVGYYTQKEEHDQEMMELRSDLDSAIRNMETQFQSGLRSIDDRYADLNYVIDGNKHIQLATKKANALNPLGNEQFYEQYLALLTKYSSTARVDSFKKMKERFDNLNLMSIASTADQLLTGGRFSGLIEFMSNAFDDGIKYPGQEFPVLTINSIFYAQDIRRDGKISLTPVDEAIRNGITSQISKNNRYVTISKKLHEYYIVDGQQNAQLTALIGEATRLRKKYKALTVEMFEPYVKDTASMFDKSRLNSLYIKDEFEASFDPDVDEVEKFYLRSRSEKLIDKLNTLNSECQILMEEIKAQYDRIYEEVPKKRNMEIKGFESDLPELCEELIQSQTDIIIYYTIGEEGEEESIQERLKSIVGE